MFLPVVMSPCELFLNIAPRFKGLESFDHLQVRDSLQFRVLGSVVVLLGHHDALLEEVLVDCYSVLFGHQHPKTKRYQNTVLTHQQNNFQGVKYISVVTIIVKIRWEPPKFKTLFINLYTIVRLGKHETETRRRTS